MLDIDFNMNIQSTRQSPYSTPTAKRREFPSVEQLRRKIYAGDAFVGAVQGAIEGSTAVFTAGGDYARAPMSMAAGAGIAVKSGRGDVRQKVAFSALRSIAYGAMGTAFGTTGSLVAIGLGAAVGATMAVLETRAEFAAQDAKWEQDFPNL